MATIQDKIMNALRRFKKQGVTRKDLAKRAGLRPKERARFNKTVDELRAQDKLVERGGRLYPLDTGAQVPGEVIKVTATFGFARPEGAERDAFIPGRMLHGALPGDKVLLRIRESRGELPEGEVVKITERTKRPFSGVVVRDNGRHYVKADRALGAPVRISKNGLHGAQPGDKVLVEVIERGERHMDHLGRVVEVFGSAESAAACARAVLAQHDIPLEFPEEALAQAAEVAAAGIHPKELEARLDLRGEIIFTIDGADSKDLDDAVHVHRRDNGWELGVHIADVSHYVRENTPLDTEALRRGTSVYYADAVVPMLPEELSNGICSLNPGEDRLAFSALLDLDVSGKLRGYRFAKSVIRSRVKGVYSELNALVDGQGTPELEEKYRAVRERLPEMVELYNRLAHGRAARGSMELDSVEGKIVLDDAGEVVNIVARERGVFERLIEEFMLTANEAAATLAVDKGLPFVYRVHDAPSPDRLELLYEVLDRLGVTYRRAEGDDVALLLGGILEAVRGQPYAGVVNTLTLRSMAKAIYSEQCKKHFGLQLERYAHFTSPIRRYPDLTIHRILSGYVTGMKRENIDKRYTAFAAESAARSTEREIAAMTAERDCEDCYKAQYMKRFVGEEFDGVISGATAHGAYVQLPNTVEGLVRLEGFPAGDWEFDGQIAFANRLGGAALQLGDAVRVKVLGVDVSAGQVDFAMVAAAEE